MNNDEIKNVQPVLHKANVIGSAFDGITCTADGCKEPATADYNGHGAYACDYHNRRWNDYFDEEYS